VTKIAIVGGTGAIGEVLTHRLVNSNLPIEKIVLIGRRQDKAKGKTLDFEDASIITQSSTEISYSDDYEAVEDAKIVVMTAGQIRTEKMQREDLLRQNALIISGVGQAIRKKASSAFIIVVTNPLDNMTAHMHNVVDGPPEKICGMAAQLDSARFTKAIAEEFAVEPEAVSNAMVFGEHGPSMVPVFSQVRIKGEPITVTEEQQERIRKRVQGAGAQIIGLLKTGGATQGPAAGIQSIIESHLHPKGKIIPSAALFRGEYGIKDVFMGAATYIDRDGVKIIKTPLSPSEAGLLHMSAYTIKKTNAALDLALQHS
jgi:malate dehydrogenase